MPLAHEAEGSRGPRRALVAQHEPRPVHPSSRQPADRRRPRRSCAPNVAAAGALVLAASAVPFSDAAPFPVTTPDTEPSANDDGSRRDVQILPARSKGESLPQRDAAHTVSHVSATRQGLADEDNIDVLAENLKHFEDAWKAGRFETHVAANSHEDGSEGVAHEAAAMHPHGKGKGKGRAREPTSPYFYNLEALHDVPLRKAEKSKSTMRLTSQRSPFHSSEVGKLASQHPDPLSVGLFRPDYPFVPSGRRRPRPSLFNSTNKAGVYDYRKGAAQHGSLYTLPADVTHGNVFKYGWTSSMLDDDMKLSVPDEFRRPRRDSALAIAKRIAGLPWYRWKPGEGYILSTSKDYSAYKDGPGIALGQLLPPREHPYTSHLPLIPNDAKRDLVWMVFWCILVLSILAFGSEIRAFWRMQRKGKQKQHNIPLIRILHDERGVNSSSLAQQSSIGLRSRQRSKARSIREMCKAALDSPFTRLRSRNAYMPLRTTDVRGKQNKSNRQHMKATVDSSNKSISLLGLGGKYDLGKKKKRSSSEAESSSEVEEGYGEDGAVMATSREPSVRPKSLLVRVMSAPCPSTASNSTVSAGDYGKNTDLSQLVFVSGVDNTPNTAGNRSSGSSSGSTNGSASTSKSGSAAGSSSSASTSIDMYSHPDSGCSIAARLASIQPYHDFSFGAGGSTLASSSDANNKRRRRNGSVHEYGASSYLTRTPDVGVRH